MQARFELRQTSVSAVDSHSSYLCSIIRVTVELDNAVLSISPRSVVNMVRKYIQLAVIFLLMIRRIIHQEWLTLVSIHETVTVMKQCTSCFKAVSTVVNYCCG